MPNIEKYPNGAFCWAELATTDQEGAKRFYTELFGWTVREFPMGVNDFYTMFQLQDRDTGAVYTLRPEMLAEGIPAHWMIYVSVESADESAARAAGLGGKVLAPALDVYDVGRMAVLEDPTGAQFAVWQAKKHIGFGIAGTPHTFCWADLITRDPQRASKFYSGLFGWNIVKGEKDDYLHIKNGEEFIGGIPVPTQGDAHFPSHWMLYFSVADCDASAEKAEELGARFYLFPTTIEGVGRMAVIRDRQSAGFAIFQAMPRR
jgi:predicted enzyme related to lactoylglutathione lyase